MMQPDCDVLVIGGGPAGAVAATRLKALGVDVILVARARSKPATEGLAPRTMDALQNLGFARAAALSTAPVVRQAHWNGEVSAANSECLVDRTDFDAALLVCAREAGVRVVEGSVERKEYGEEGWRIHAREKDRGNHYRARIIVEARGRRALPLAESALRGPPTFSLVRWYEGAKAGKGFTALSSHPHGWCWLAASGDGRVCVQAITGFEKAPPGPRVQLMDMHGAIARDMMDTHGAVLAERLTPLGDISVRDAHIALSKTPVSRRMIRVGDAAASVDPLSGHGVFQAISSGLAAAPTVNTLLYRPEQAELAIAFYASRVKSRFMHQVDAGREFYGQETRWCAHPFWRDRRVWGRGGGKPRQARTPDGLSVFRRAVVEKGFIVERDVLVTPAHADGVFLLDGVPLAALWRETRTSASRSSEDDLARRFDVSPHQISLALHWLRVQSEET